MNIHAPLDPRVHDSRVWWVMVAGCATRFSAERDAASAVAGLLFWLVIFIACRVVRSSTLGRADAEQRLVRAGNVVAIVGSLLFLVRLNADGLIPAMLTFLFAIQAAAFVTAKKRVHMWLILAAALGGVLFAAAESRSSWFLFGAAWFTFAGLRLLAVDQRLERERAMVATASETPAGTTGGFAFACIALAVTIPLYLFVPKPAGLLLGGMEARTAHDYRDPFTDASDAAPSESSAAPDREPSDSPASESNAPTSTARPEQGDYGEEFSPENVQRDAELANDIVLYVKSSQPIYLRGLAYDRFENDRWHRDVQPVAELSLTRGNVEVPYVYGEDRVQQSVEVVRDLTTTLWHAPGLQRLRFPGPTVRRYEDDVFVVPRMLRADTLYSVESRVNLRAGRYALVEPRPRDIERYLRAETASDRVRALARSLTQGIADSRAKALVLEAHLRDNYEFTYETVPQQGYTPLDRFLFETKRGHCEYFASALAMLLRAVDVPARVVTGFSLGEPNPATGYYEVRRLDGHAWVEAHVGEGWLMLEPTPFYPLPAPATDSQVAAQVDRYLERMARTAALLEPESFSASVIQTARNAWRGSRETLRALTDATRALGWKLVVWIVLIALLLPACYLAVLAILDALDNRDVRDALARARAAKEGAATLLAARALQAAGAQRGFERMPGTSFREYVGELTAAGSRVPGELADDFDVVRYGSASRGIAPDVLERVVASIEAQLAADPRPRLRRTLASWRRRRAPLTTS